MRSRDCVAVTLGPGRDLQGLGLKKCMKFGPCGRESRPETGLWQAKGRVTAPAEGPASTPWRPDQGLSFVISPIAAPRASGHGGGRTGQKAGAGCPGPGGWGF